MSYDEIICFKQSVVRCDDNQFLPAFPDSFTQLAADNVDHNVRTLDDVNTFHGVR